MKLLAALRSYMASDDPRVAVANLIAMVLAWNTPFYPLYLLGAAGAAMQPGAWLTLAIFPVFLVVPAVTRRWPLPGRVLLAAAGLANTVWCTWLLGEGSGTQLFLLPCIFLAAIIFRQAERRALLSLLALPVIAGLTLHARYPSSPFACHAAICENVVWLNAFSVALLCSFLGLIIARMLSNADMMVSVPGRAPASTRRQQPPIR